MPPSAWQVLWRAHALGLAPAASRSGGLSRVRNAVECSMISGLAKCWAPWPTSPHQNYRSLASFCILSIGAECSASGKDKGAADSGDGSGGDAYYQSGSQIGNQPLPSKTATAFSFFKFFHSDPAAQQLTYNRDGHHTPIRATSTAGTLGPYDAIAGSAALWRRSFSSSEAREFRESAKCWSCGSEREAATLFFCNDCGAIQSASDTADYFQLLGVAPSFMVDLPAVEGRYKALQRKLHPDMYATKQKVERDFSAEQSSLVNKAYSTLVHPLSRATYLLRLSGVEAGEGEEGTMSDIELLSEVMEIREAIEEAEDIKDLQKLHQENTEKMRQSGAAFAAALQAGNLQQALEWVHRMTYWDRIDKEITRKL